MTSHPSPRSGSGASEGFGDKGTSQGPPDTAFRGRREPWTTHEPSVTTGSPRPVSSSGPGPRSAPPEVSTRPFRVLRQHLTCLLRPDLLRPRVHFETESRQSYTGGEDDTPVRHLQTLPSPFRRSVCRRAGNGSTVSVSIARSTVSRTMAGKWLRRRSSWMIHG